MREMTLRAKPEPALNGFGESCKEVSAMLRGQGDITKGFQAKES